MAQRKKPGKPRAGTPNASTTGKTKRAPKQKGGGKKQGRNK
jgi:hypothetical protein